MNALTEITPFERAIIEHILALERPDLLVHLPLLGVKKRENTGVGIYVEIEYSDDTRLVDADNLSLGHSVYAEIDGLEGGAGFVLYVDNGRITMLEGFSHSSKPWPAHIEKFRIQYL